MKVIAALDRSPRDTLVLEECARIASSEADVVRLVHVVSLPSTLVPHHVRDAEAYLEAVRMSLRELGIHALAEVHKGDVPAEITRAAEEHDADLVVIATRGRRGLDRIALGSIAEAVVATSTRPVMIVNEATHRAKLDDDVRRKSSYIASVIWAKVARGELAPHEAKGELARAADRGLDMNTMTATYEAVASDGIPPDWLDVAFQLRVLAEFMPEEVAALREITSAAEAAA